MTITAMTIKFLGKKSTVYRVLDSRGEVLQVLCTEQEAAEWVKSQA